MEDITLASQEVIDTSDRRQVIEEVAVAHRGLPEWVEDLVREVGERLNRTDIHFAAELIQNAEDAGNRLDKTRVELRFLIEENRISAQNDGLPFNAKDVKAICRAAASSKRHDPNQIGFLGVGFKSVFKITEAPEIYSNGFHFRITRYIHPSWLDVPTLLPDSNMHSAFVFPLKPSVNLHALSDEFDRLKPTLLLFLKKLKSIAIENRITGQTNVIELRDNIDNTSTLTSSQGHQLWRITTLYHWMPARELRPADREHHDVIDIRAAFFLSDNGRFARLASSLFFAFLPTEQETGLGFHLQADFVPTLSRESIEDNEWNRAILANAAQGLVQQVCAFRDEGTHDVDLYNLLPLEEETRDIAVIIARDAYVHASSERLIFTRGEVWYAADDAFQPAYSGLCDLLTAEDLSRHYGRPVDFLHSKIGGRNLTVAKRLGVPIFDISDLVGMLGNPHWADNQSDDWLVHLLIFLYEKREHIDSALLQQLRQLRLLPLQNGGRAAPDPSLNNRPIYLPLKNELVSSYTLFSEHLDLVAQQLIEAADTTGCGEQLLRAIRWLDVKPYEPQIVIDEIILPLFESQAPVSRDVQLHSAYLDFVRRHWEQYKKRVGTDSEETEARNESVRHAAAVLRFRTQGDELNFSLATNLALGKAYAAKENLEKILKDLPGVQFMSDEYTVAEHAARKRKLFAGPPWKDFLHDLGALDWLDVVRVIDTIIVPEFQSDRWKGNNWFQLTDFIRRHVDEYERERRKQYPDQEPLGFLKQHLWVLSTRRDSSRWYYHPNQLHLHVIEGDAIDLQTSFSPLIEHYFYNCDEYVWRGVLQDDKVATPELHDSWVALFRRLGAKLYTPVTLIEQVIIPAYEQNKWQILNEAQQLQALDFVRRHYSTYVDAKRQQNCTEQQTNERLSNAFMLLTRSDDSRYRYAPELFLTQSYGLEENLEQRLVGLSGIEFINDCYIEHERKSPIFSGPSWREFLSKLGVNYRFDVVQIIDRCILPQFAGDSAPDGWFALTDFVRQHISEYEKRRQEQEARKHFWEQKEPLVDLREGLRLASTKKRDGQPLFDLPRSLYRSRPYWDSADIALAFSSMLSENQVSDTYWKQSSLGKNEVEQRALLQSWREFLDKLGVTGYLPLLARFTSNVWSYPGYGTTWRGEHSTRSTSINDSWNDLVEAFIQKLQPTDRQHVAQSRAFLRMLDRYWDTAYKSYLTATHSWFYYYSQSKAIPSAFAAILKEQRWIPTASGKLVSSVSKLFDYRLRQHIGDPDIVCAEEIRSPHLRSFLNIRDTLTIDDILELLNKAAVKDQPDKAQLRSLYAWLQEQWSKFDETQRSRIMTIFAETPLIYVPGVTPTWCTSQECTWQTSPLTLIAQQIPSLASSYDGLRPFFVEHIQVNEAATIYDILNVLTSLADSGSLPEKQFRAVYQCYEELEKHLPGSQVDLDCYSDDPLWLCSDGSLRPRYEIYINDNVTLFELFDSKVRYLWMPSGTPSGAFKTLWSAFDLKSLSGAVPAVAKGHLETGAEVPLDWPEHLQRLVELITRYLYTFQHEVFLSLWADGRIKKLCQLRIVPVAVNIPIVYQLTRGETAAIDQAIFVALDQEHMYIAPDLQADDFALAQEFARVLSADRELQNFIETLVARLGSPKLDQFIKQKNLVTLLPDQAELMLQWMNEHSLAQVSDEPFTAEPHLDKSEVDEEHIDAANRLKPKEDVSSAKTDVSMPKAEQTKANSDTNSTDQSAEHGAPRPEEEVNRTPSQQDDDVQSIADNEQSDEHTSPGGRVPTSGDARPAKKKDAKASGEKENQPQANSQIQNEETSSGRSSKAGSSANMSNLRTEDKGSGDEVRAEESRGTLAMADEVVTEEEVPKERQSGREQHSIGLTEPKDDQGSDGKRQTAEATSGEEATVNGQNQKSLKETEVPAPSASSSAWQHDGKSHKDKKRSERTERTDRPRPRLRSYVEHSAKDKDHSDEDAEETQAERESITRAGIDAAVSYEEFNGRFTKVLAHNHKGWDIDAYDDEKHRDVTRRIEVKATRFPWDGWGVYLTAAEFEAAQEYGEKYFLYVVERALDPVRRRIYVFRNPAKLVAEYRFDEKWKDAASDSYMIANISGLTIQVPTDQPSRNQSSDVSLSLTSSTSVQANGTDRSLETILISAWEKANKQDGWVDLSVLGTTLRQIQPGFRPQSYAYTGLLALVTVHSQMFEIRKTGIGTIHVRRWKDSRFDTQTELERGFANEQKAERKSEKA